MDLFEDLPTGDRSRLYKILLIYTLIVVSVELLIIIQYVNGYQASIYRQLPVVLLVLGGIVVVTSIVGSVFLLSREMTTGALLALLPLVVQILLTMILPYLLGYMLQSGDIMSHAGDVRTIRANGFIVSAPRADFANQYRPLFHLLVVELAEVSGTLFVFPKNFVVFGVLDLVQSILLILLVGLFCRRAGFPMIFSVFGTVLVVFTGIAPSNFGHEVHLMVALYLWVILMAPNPDRRFIVLFGLVVAGLWPLHQLPPVTLAVIAGLSLLLTFPRVRDLQMSVGFEPVRDLTLGLLILTALIAIPGYLWWTYAPYFRLAVIKTFGLSTATTQSGTELASTLFDKFGFTAWEFAVLVGKLYGPMFILFLLAGIGIILVVLPQDRVETPRISAVLLIPLLISAIWAPIEFFGGNLVAGWGRALYPARLVAPVFVGVLLYYSFGWIRRIRYKRAFAALTVLIVLTTTLTTGALLHEARLQSSPWVSSGNNYIAESEIHGWEWYFDMKSPSAGTVTLARDPGRYEDLLLTVRERVERHDQITYGSAREPTKVPPHFGNTTLGALYGKTYYLDTEPARLNRLDVHPEWGVFTREDFERLTTDSTANAVYRNGNVNVYAIGVDE